MSGERERTRMEGEQAFEMARTLKRCTHFLDRGAGRCHSSQGQILWLLSRREEIPQQELQERMDIRQGSLSELVKKLEDQGLVVRVSDPEDRRKMLVRLSEKGREVQAERRQGLIDRAVEAFSVLEPQEWEELSRLLHKLLDSWKEQERPGCCPEREESEGV